MHSKKIFYIILVLWSYVKYMFSLTFSEHSIWIWKEYTSNVDVELSAEDDVKNRVASATHEDQEHAWGYMKRI